MGRLILVTGANGYIASRLVPRLLQAGHRVRALAREPVRLAGRAWLPDVEVMGGSTTDPASIERALAGVDTAYYLIHNMASGRGYVGVEKESARQFARAADKAGVGHIIYLGGLADPASPNLAPHLRSRIETGEILRQGRVPVTEFRAGVIVGAGSISFEMIRFLTECFPVLPGPTWLRNQSQPIAAANVIDYLTAGLERPQARGGIYEMGGPERMLYADTMLRYAKSRSLRRWLFTLPGIPIGLMARFVDWLTPVPFPIATALVGGLQSDSIVVDDAAQKTFPEVKLVPYEAALEAALADLAPAHLERVWAGLGRDVVSMKHEGFLVDYRRVEVRASAPAVYGVLIRMGGQYGWPYANWLWRLRGWLDGFFAPRGPRTDTKHRNGMRRNVEPAASANPGMLVGDRVDYYRVEAVEPGRMIRLHSELRSPGEGWMEWSIEPDGNEAVLAQTAFFAPHGLPGFAYWLLLGPLHRLVFRGLIHAIKRRSEAG